ncbi:MAG: hypothetical protein EZS28_056636, partial [Streblomastix strix]
AGLNRLFQPPEWQLEIRMAHVIKTVLTGMLIAPFMPLAVPIIAIYFFLMFWIEKINVLRFFRAPPQYSKEIIDSTFMFLEV